MIKLFGKFALAGSICFVILQVIAKDDMPKKNEACAPIRAACEKAGYIEGGLAEGKGLYAQCMYPVLGLGEKGPAGKFPLPKLDKLVIEACKKTNPKF